MYEYIILTSKNTFYSKMKLYHAPTRSILPFSFSLLLNSISGQYSPHFAPGHSGIIHLFEWHWNTIANECETFLGPKKVGGVQISPPHENRIIDGRPWWERYQPISYKFSTRSGDEDDLKDMIERCNAVGVRIYADVVPNHMCGAGGTGVGTGGTYRKVEMKVEILKKSK